MDTWMQKLRAKIEDAIGNLTGVYFQDVADIDALVDAMMVVMTEHLEDHDAFEAVVQSEPPPPGAPTSTEIIDEDRGE